MAELIKMYEGQVNSPAAELSEDINSTVTTIKLVDSSILPHAPNMAVIGVGENAETILYAGKNDTTNELLNVTRGFQAQARAWAVGIKVRRLFTAYDWDSIRQNAENMNTELETNSSDIDELQSQTADLELNKVDKIVGKGLSTNDYTTTEKNKLAGIEAGAQKNTVTSVAGKTGAVTLTKSNVGLGSVSDYGIATQAEAEVGTSNTKYMTPLRVKQAIESLGTKVVTGTYVGTGAAERTIVLGFRPKVVIVYHQKEGARYRGYFLGDSYVREGYGGIAIDGFPGYSNGQDGITSDTDTLVEIVSNGFAIGHDSEKDMRVNIANGIYGYIAF